MKRLVVMLLLLAAGFAQAAATMTLVEARKNIAAAIASPALAKATMSKLGPADQVAYVAALNAAIATLPGSSEELAAISLKLNAAAVLGTSKGNLKAVVAEVFATASLESLPVIHETFAEKLFNRSGNSSATYTDAQFVKISGEVMKVVNSRVTSVDNSDSRSGFAALMFLKASNTPQAPEMIDAIVQMLPPAVRETAKSEWIPAATSSEPDYGDMMAGSSASELPENDIIITVAGPINSVGLFGDLTSTYDGKVVGTITDAIFNPFQNAQAPMGDGAKEGPQADLRNNEYIDEPRGYQWQVIR